MKIMRKDLVKFVKKVAKKFKYKKSEGGRRNYKKLMNLFILH